MMRIWPIIYGALAVIVTALGSGIWAPHTAIAGDNDLVLSRLGSDPGEEGGIIGDNSSFRSMASELGVVLAPRLLAPADTLGFGGFQFTLDVGVTTVDADAPHWRVRGGVDDPNSTGPYGSSTMSTLGLFVRKGMWLPMPSFEVGGGLVNLFGARMMAAQGYGKLALHEGFHGWPLPSLALRGAISRMMGEAELDLTVVSIDGSVSKDIGIGNTFALSPYGGYNALIIIPRSEVIDRTPNVGGDADNLFAFSDQDAILRHRLFAGVRVKYYVFTASIEGILALAGSSTNDVANTDQACMPGAFVALCDAEDQSSVQTTITLSLGTDF